MLHSLALHKHAIMLFITTSNYQITKNICVNVGKSLTCGLALEISQTQVYTMIITKRTYYMYFHVLKYYISCNVIISVFLNALLFIWFNSNSLSAILQSCGSLFFQFPLTNHTKIFCLKFLYSCNYNNRQSS